MSGFLAGVCSLPTGGATSIWLSASSTNIDRRDCPGTCWEGAPKLSFSPVAGIVELRKGAVALRLGQWLRFPSPLISRVGDWRAGLGRSLCSLLARSFVCECHTISAVPRFQPPPRRTQHADFPHCAHLSASPQGLWDLSCRSRFRRGSYNAIALEEAQFVVHPLPTPPLPIEALTIPSTLHMAPDLLFHPVFHEVEALAGMSDREVIHPST